MAGLLKPRAAPLLVEAIRSVTDLPIHFHTHATSSCSLATALEMARAGCDVIDFATASMADCTSQPRSEENRGELLEDVIESGDETGGLGYCFPFDLKNPWRFP